MKEKLVNAYNIYLLEDLKVSILIFVLILNAYENERREINIFSGLLKVLY